MNATQSQTKISKKIDRMLSHNNEMLIKVTRPIDDNKVIGINNFVVVQSAFYFVVVYLFGGLKIIILLIYNDSGWTTNSI